MYRMLYTTAEAGTKHPAPAASIRYTVRRPSDHGPANTEQQHPHRATHTHTHTAAAHGTGRSERLYLGECAESSQQQCKREPGRHTALHTNSTSRHHSQASRRVHPSLPLSLSVPHTSVIMPRTCMYHASAAMSNCYFVPTALLWNLP